MLIRQGYPESYATGFQDGQISGHAAGGDVYSRLQKDTYRFDSDARYKQGWQDGFNTGKGQEESTQRLVNSSF